MSSGLLDGIFQRERKTGRRENARTVMVRRSRTGEPLGRDPKKPTKYRVEGLSARQLKKQVKAARRKVRAMNAEQFSQAVRETEADLTR